MTVADIRERLRDYPATAKVRFQGVTDDTMVMMAGDISDAFLIGRTVTLGAILTDVVQPI